MKYEGETTSVVKEGEKVDIVPKDKNCVEVSYSVTFHEHGVYRVDVSDKRIVITKEASDDGKGT